MIEILLSITILPFAILSAAFTLALGIGFVKWIFKK